MYAAQNVWGNIHAYHMDILIWQIPPNFFQDVRDRNWDFASTFEMTDQLSDTQLRSPKPKKIRAKPPGS